MLLGARIADGCTSGNGISGISLLSIGSMIVIASMFIGGILVVQLYKKLNRERIGHDNNNFNLVPRVDNGRKSWNRFSKNLVYLNRV